MNNKGKDKKEMIEIMSFKIRYLFFMSCLFRCWLNLTLIRREFPLLFLIETTHLQFYYFINRIIYYFWFIYLSITYLQYWTICLFCFTTRPDIYFWLFFNSIYRSFQFLRDRYQQLLVDKLIPLLLLRFQQTLSEVEHLILLSFDLSIQRLNIAYLLINIDLTFAE